MSNLETNKTKESTKNGLVFIYAKVREACNDLGFNDCNSVAKGTAALQDACSRIVNYHDIDSDTQIFDFSELLVAASYAENGEIQLARKYALKVLEQLRKSEKDGLLK
jgi:regulator of sigma D